MMSIIRRALTTVQIVFDHSGNLIATSRSTARATTILNECNYDFNKKSLLNKNNMSILPRTH